MQHEQLGMYSCSGHVLIPSWVPLDLVIRMDYHPLSVTVLEIIKGSDGLVTTASIRKHGGLWVFLGAVKAPKRRPKSAENPSKSRPKLT